MTTSYINRVKSWTLAVLLTVFAGGSIMTAAAPTPVSAACVNPLLTFPVWYRGLVDADCNFKDIKDVGGLSGFIWRIVLNVLDIMLQLVGYAAVGFILYGGFKYMTSSGSADGSAKARTTILNAVIGLVISIASVGAVNLLLGVLK